MAFYGASRPESREHARRMVKRGGVLLAIGVVVTAGSYLFASATHGSLYIVSIGPLLYGVINLIQGARGLSALPAEAGAPSSQPYRSQDRPAYRPTLPARPDRRTKPGSAPTWRPKDQ